MCILRPGGDENMASQSDLQPVLLTTTEAAALLRVSTAFLRRDRRRSNPAVPVMKLGPRTYRYEPGALRRLAASPSHLASRGC